MMTMMDGTKNMHVPKAFDPEHYRDNGDLPKLRHLPEEVPIDQAEVAACEEVGRGLYTLVDIYIDQMLWRRYTHHTIKPRSPSSNRNSYRSAWMCFRSSDWVSSVTSMPRGRSLTSRANGDLY